MFGGKSDWGGCGGAAVGGSVSGGSNSAIWLLKSSGLEMFDWK